MTDQPPIQQQQQQPNHDTSSLDGVVAVIPPPTTTTKFWTIKKIVIVCLFLLMILLRYTIYQLQYQKHSIQQRIQQIQQQSRNSTASSSIDDDDDDDAASNGTTTTTTTLNTTKTNDDIEIQRQQQLLWEKNYHHQHRRRRQLQTNTRQYQSQYQSSSSSSSSDLSLYLQNKYWEQVVQSNLLHEDLIEISQNYDSNYNIDETFDSLLGKTRYPQQQLQYHNNISVVLEALHNAALHGHALAQHIIANAYMSGYYSSFSSSTTVVTTTTTTTASTTVTEQQQQQQQLLQVSDSWWIQYQPTTHVMNETNQEFISTSSSSKDAQQDQQQQQQQRNPGDDRLKILYEQQTKAMLYYQMAAIGGNVDAMISLGYRMEHLPTSSTVAASSNAGTTTTKTTTESSSSSSATTPPPPSTQCSRSIPYYSSAAHHVIDMLMDDINSRGMLTPYQDRHVLYKIHVHGGKNSIPASSGNADNEPYEGSETIQFFKIKAAPLLLNQQQRELMSSSSSSSPPNQRNTWSSRIKKWWSKSNAKTKQDGTDNNNKSNKNEDYDSKAPSAAYALGLYYTGARGGEVNTSMALQYYSAAAYAGHWEAAGQAGLFYFYNIGFDTTRHTTPNNTSIILHNREMAYTYFKLGAPFELNGCHQRYQLKVQKQQEMLNGANTQQQQNDRIFLCDSESLNGLGLIHLFGLPSKNISINIPRATRYFELARDQGNENAAYNVAMMKLGWRTHYNGTVTTTSTNATTTTDKLDDETSHIVESSRSNGVVNVDVSDESVDETTATLPAAKIEAEKMFPLKLKDDKKNNLPEDRLTALEYKEILVDLSNAAKKGHILARHRLAMIYETGILIPPVVSDDATDNKNTGGKSSPDSSYAIEPDCEFANLNYKWILDHASPMLAKRMRRAYLHYMAGNYADSLKYYLYLAEMGHEVALVNAAFLLELGVCPSLNDIDCAKASVRFWKVAAASHNHAEANMRVGDFYYYGRFRTTHDRAGGGSDSIPVGPWGWMHYIIFPERYLLPLLWKELKRQIINFSLWEPLSILDVSGSKSVSNEVASHNQQQLMSSVATCTSENDEDTCAAKSSDNSDNNHHEDIGLRRRRQQLDDDLEMAAQYYKLAADKPGIARAHFNLGYMYEWGLGTKQDFPLAKRHYDLAMQASSREADVPISLALMLLSFHEYCVKLKLSWDSFWQSQSSSTITDKTVEESQEL